MEDDFESDLGWTTGYLGATAGYWQRGVPVDDPGWDYDPESDADGSGQCYLTQNIYGNTDVDGGEVWLISPVFDLTEGGDIEYDYYLYLTNTDGNVDMLLVEISSNGGGSWTEIARHDTDGGLYWRHHRITESDLALAGVTLTANMQMRFTANDANPQSIVEAGVDAFRISRITCEDPGCCGKYTGGYTGNTDCDVEGRRNLTDITKLVDRVYIIPEVPLCCEENGDVNGDGKPDPNLADITVLIDHVYVTHVETAPCP
jgi:hypothetical protein